MLLLGEREKNLDHVNEAVTALEAAVTERPRERLKLFDGFLREVK